ncbi:MAG: hypothetical protein BGO78_08830 [Chloroflexi bacterium 44-23]|nr:MAG: hypothetical protein BGO78_08830 [Chloroflexi bacterium 44-23]
MDKLDHMMFNLPGQTIPAGLTEKLQSNFKKRYQARQRVVAVLAMSSFFGGLFLIVPGLNQLYQIVIRLQSGWETISASLNWIVAGNVQFDSLWYLGNLHGNWLSSLAMPTWLGLFLLGCGAALALKSWLPTILREV